MTAGERGNLARRGLTHRAVRAARVCAVCACFSRRLSCGDCVSPSWTRGVCRALTAPHAARGYVLTRPRGRTRLLLVSVRSFKMLQRQGRSVVPRRAPVTDRYIHIILETTINNHRPRAIARAKEDDHTPRAPLIEAARRVAGRGERAGQQQHGVAPGGAFERDARAASGAVGDAGSAAKVHCQVRRHALRWRSPNAPLEPCLFLLVPQSILPAAQPL